MKKMTDVWQGDDFNDHRVRIAAQWLRGSGIEIGGLHKPIALPPGAWAKYVDLRTHEQADGLNAHEVLVPDIVSNGFILEAVRDESVDFVIGNHLLEHCPDFYGTIKRWLSKLRPGGTIYSALPIVDRCFDHGRLVTPTEHFFSDHIAFAHADVGEILKRTREHILDFALVSGRNITNKKGLPAKSYVDIYAFADRITEGLREKIKATQALTWDGIIEAHGQMVNLKYDLHYHTFLPSSIQSLLTELAAKEGIVIEELTKSGGGECIFVLSKPSHRA